MLLTRGCFSPFTECSAHQAERQFGGDFKENKWNSKCSHTRPLTGSQDPSSLEAQGFLNELGSFVGDAPL